MVQYAEPLQTPIGLFSDLTSAQSAFKALQEAGFAANRLSLVPQALDPDPAVKDTEAANSAKGGVVAGAVFGALIGLLLGFMSISTFGVGAPDPTKHLIGMVLAGSAVGTAAGGVLGALVGSNVHKGLTEPADSNMKQNYLILATGTQEELAEAQTILQQHGSIIPNEKP